MTFCRLTPLTSKIVFTISSHSQFTYKNNQENKLKNLTTNKIASTSGKCFSSFYFFLLLSLPYTLYSQIGAHLNTIQWQQINVKDHTIVFPKKFKHQAFRVGSILEYMDNYSNRSIGEKQYPLQILIHNQTTISNGFVGVSPYRSEFFATPPLSPNRLGTVNWLDGLTIHEYRHAQQYANSRVGLSKIAHYLMGDNGWGLALSLSPNWFWEGDAVFMETALSNQGRGRSPFFSRLQRSLLLHNVDYSYQKARNGSYKDVVPNQYPLGYILTAYARKQFGHDIWKEVFKDASSYRHILYPFSWSLKKHTGLSSPQLYKAAYLEAKKNWKKEQSNLPLSVIQRMSPSQLKTPTFYRFPYALRDNSLVYLKNSFQKTTGLYQLKNGKEKRLCSIGFNIEPYLSVTGNKAIWMEFGRNPRRFEQNYSTLVYYDFLKQQKVRLTNKSKLFTPSFSHREDKIIAVQITPEQQNNLVILSVQNGQIINTLSNPENYFLLFPKWTEGDRELVFIAKKNSQLALFKYLLSDNKLVQISNWTHHIISDLFVKNDRVYFTSSFSGIDNIYSVDLSTPTSGFKEKTFSPTLRQHSSVSIGAYFPSLSTDGKKLLFSEYHHEGFYLSSIELKETASKQLASKLILEPTEQTRYPINQISKEGGNILDKVPTKAYPITTYKGLFKGLKLHSWNLTPSVAVPSLDIQMDNLLNDVSVNLLGGYNINEQRAFYAASMTYGKWYPQIRLLVGSGKRNAIFQSPADTLALQQFSQHTIGSTVSVPLTWNKGDYRTSIQPFINYSHRFIRNPIFEEIEKPNFSLSTFALGTRFSNLRRTAYQQVDTRFGQVLDISYNQTLDDRSERQFHLESSFYFPGIGQNHSIKFDLHYRKQALTDQYQFSDRFEYPRGYSTVPNNRFTKVAVNYQLPIVYPDWGFHGITYFKRVRANLFFDYGKARNDFLKQTEFKSVGIEVMLDNHFFMELPVTIGWRNSFLLNKEIDRKYNFEFFITSEFF